MKRLNFFILAISLHLLQSSCSKSFLDVEDNTILLREQYVKDINSLQQYLNGIYVLLSKDIYNGTTGDLIYAELIADNIKPSTTNTSNLIAHYTWNQSSTEGSKSNMENLWKLGYQLIRACNFAITKADAVKNENITKANQIKGEALTLRALTHFVLLNTFAQQYNFSSNGNHLGIPYITTSDWNDPFKRNTVNEVYTGIINDLLVAIPLLPAETKKTLIINRLAAKALLARIYLYKEDWLQAKNIALEIATEVPLLASEKYPKELFTLNETEALFQLAPSSTNVVAGSYTTAFPGVYFRSTAFLATKDIADLLTQNPNDKRKIWISSGGEYKDSIRKYPINIIPNFGTGINPARSYYQTIFRSSEMFLTVAEASAKVGDEITARNYLDAIRQRADPSLSPTTATGAELLDSIYLERRKELAFEGLRMYDLLRWKKPVNRTDVATGGLPLLTYPNDKATSPIPAVDVLQGIPQNPGY